MSYYGGNNNSSNDMSALIINVWCVHLEQQVKHILWRSCLFVIL